MKHLGEIDELVIECGFWAWKNKKLWNQVSVVNHPKTQEENSLEMSSEAAEKMNMYETMMESLVSDDSRFMLDGKKKF